MEFIALAGPMYSGKTSVASGLVDQGFMQLQFSDMLKDLATEMMQAIGVNITRADLAHPITKSKYRGFLQELGVVLDIDNDPKWIDLACGPWLNAKQPPAVIEAIRTPVQGKEIQRRGFYLVYLDLTRKDQIARAQKLGVDNLELIRQLQHPVENYGTTLRRMADVVLNSSVLSTEQIVTELIRQHIHGYDEVAG